MEVSGVEKLRGEGKPIEEVLELPLLRQPVDSVGLWVASVISEDHSKEAVFQQRFAHSFAEEPVVIVLSPPHERSVSDVDGGFLGAAAIPLLQV
jgi:hypothetical protein